MATVMNEHSICSNTSSGKRFYVDHHKEARPSLRPALPPTTLILPQLVPLLPVWQLILVPFAVLPGMGLDARGSQSTCQSIVVDSKYDDKTDTYSS